jgi:hypothetical protein
MIPKKCSRIYSVIPGGTHEGGLTANALVVRSFIATFSSSCVCKIMTFSHRKHPGIPRWKISGADLLHAPSRSLPTLVPRTQKTRVASVGIRQAWLDQICFPRKRCRSHIRRAPNLGRDQSAGQGCGRYDPVQ